MCKREFKFICKQCGGLGFRHYDERYNVCFLCRVRNVTATPYQPNQTPTPIQENRAMNNQNPGSPEAIKNGCTCPAEDNNNGQGWHCISDVFVYDRECSIHGPAVEAHLQLAYSQAQD